ncbi:hypothetical protein [Saccharothrix obliqua]|uniref:hypothetical protein n=1 Tax=Saccharothrix obliqua TaxID=2861747 RepID=UPI001C5E7C17|nr:hypothetical protein [Saccharothrix obliqua]MBW4722436.1 hypothetical protein [Saccharothrix obliqua]
MTTTGCSHMQEMELLAAASDARLRSRASVASMESLRDLGAQIAQRCRQECGSGSPYIGQADAEENEPT